MCRLLFVAWLFSSLAIASALTEPKIVDNELIIEDGTEVTLSQSGKYIRGAGAGAQIQVRGHLVFPTTKAIFEGFAPGEVTFAVGKIDRALPQWWGAKGDGIADDTAAIQSAIQSRVGKVELPPGQYRITKPLDITNQRGGLILMGAGMGGFDTPESGSILIGETGGVVIDATGSRNLKFRDLAIKSGTNNPSSVGILYARSKTVKFVEFNSIERSKIELSTNPSANHQHGTVAIYNHAAELWRANDVHLLADNPLVMTGNDIFEIQSPYVETDKENSSMSECSVEGSSTLTSFGGSALTLENTYAIHLPNLYLNRWKGTGTFAAKLIGWNSQLHLTGNVETFHQLMNLTGALKNSEIRVTIQQRADALIRLEGKARIDNSVLNLFPAPWIAAEKNMPLFESKGKVAGIQNTKFQLHSNQSIALSGGTCSGITVQSENASPRIELPKGCSYQIHSPAGVDFHGPVRFHP